MPNQSSHLLFTFGESHTRDLYYKIYDVVFTPSYRSKEVSVEGTYRNLLSYVGRHKFRRRKLYNISHRSWDFRGIKEPFTFPALLCPSSETPQLVQL